MRNEDYSPAVHPFLTKFATARTGADEQIGRYCDMRRVWVVDTDDGPQPLVAFTSQAGQTSTTTKINVESDDTDVGSGFGLGTHTAVQAEADDIAHVTLGHALLTQTFVAAEADDEDPDIRGLDLGTTTRIMGESDDLERAITSLLAITTKTDAQLERDDTAVGLEVYEPSLSISIPPVRVH